MGPDLSIAKMLLLASCQSSRKLSHGPSHTINHTVVLLTTFCFLYSHVMIHFMSFFSLFSIVKGSLTNVDKYLTSYLCLMDSLYYLQPVGTTPPIKYCCLIPFSRSHKHFSSMPASTVLSQVKKSS